MARATISPFHIPPASVLSPLWADYARTRSDAARNRLAEAYLDVVRFRASKICERLPREVNEADLMQFGAEGLMQAIARFDPGRGIQFLTYAMPRVAGAILDGLRETARYRRATLRDAKLLAEAEDLLYVETGRRPTSAEVMGRLQVSERTYDRLRRKVPADHLSLSKICIDSDSRDVRAGDVLPDPKAQDPADVVAVRDEVDTIINDKLLGGEFRLSDALVIKCVYTLGMTMRETGQALSVTESRVCQIHARVMERLRHMCKAA